MPGDDPCPLCAPARASLLALLLAPSCLLIIAGCEGAADKGTRQAQATEEEKKAMEDANAKSAEYYKNKGAAPK